MRQEKLFDSSNSLSDIVGAVQTLVMVQFIDEYKPTYGIETICRVLPITPSTYYRTKDLEYSSEKRSQRSRHDDFYLNEIKRIWVDSKCRYGVRKVWKQLKSEGKHPARCTVERLMRQHGMQGVWRGKGKITTKSRDDQLIPIRIISI